MGTYIIRRLLQMIPVFLGSDVPHLRHGLRPARATHLAGQCGERPCSPAYAAAFREKYNLDDPLLVQYGNYIGNLVHG